MTATPVAGVGVGKLGTVVLDCPDPRRLADFYAALLGTPVDPEDCGEEWVGLTPAAGVVSLAFQRARQYTPPAWPDGPPQQLHLDIRVADLTLGHRQAVALGARPLDPVEDPLPGDERGFRVYADPAGHPFCLCRC